MLSQQRIKHILSALPWLTIGVVGDLFLDRYLDLDPALTEPSIETGLDAYQVVRVRSQPGAAGTVINNLVALGVGRIVPISVIGDDGEGYELRQALARLPGVKTDLIQARHDRRTPTYMKPMLGVTPQHETRELNRFDIKNRLPLPADAEDHVGSSLANRLPSLDVLLVSDQVSEVNCGVITTKIRAILWQLAEQYDPKPILVDSREHIGDFRSVWLKPNETECRRAFGNNTSASVEVQVRALASRAWRPVFCTLGANGILVVDPRDGCEVRVPAYPVEGSIDIVGAGDSTSAGIACALAAGASLVEAAAFGCLVASITIQQLGTTGTASPEQVRQRWRECAEK